MARVESAYANRDLPCGAVEFASKAARVPLRLTADGRACCYARGIASASRPKFSKTWRPLFWLFSG